MMNEMKINYCFPCPIAVMDFDLQLNPLISYGYKLKEKAEGRTISNRSGWQSNNVDINESIYKELLSSLTNSVNAYWKKVCNGKNNLNCANMWFNINPENSYNVSHCHPGSKVSGVFYLQVPYNSGKIYFEHPATRLEYDWRGQDDFESTNMINCSMWSFEPIENYCFLFPSWLDHEVESNKSDIDRISISFNYV